MARIEALEIPKFGMTMEEGVVDSWLIAEGEAFHKGQPVCTIESSKLSNDLEAPFDGTLRRIVAQPGDELPVGALIGVSAEPDVPESEIDAFIASRTEGAGSLAEADGAPAASDAPAVATRTVGTATPVVSTVPVAQAVAAPPAPAPTKGGLVVPDSLKGVADHDVFATTHAHLFADEHGIDIGKITGTGPAGRVSVADIETAIVAAGGTVPPKTRAPRKGLLRSRADDSRVPATPIARRIAGQLGVNLNDCRASGSRGRVTREDVETAARKFGLLADNASTASAPQATESAAPSAPEQSVTEIPMTGMRKTIGARLKASVLNSPHFRVTQDLVIDRMLGIRTQINQDVPGVKISVNDMLVKAVALALVEVPEVNVQFDEATQTIRQFAHADVSIAVALPSGLITPIVRSADTRSLSDISTSVSDMVTRAKTGKLKAEEFQGGTFSISNLGMFGVPAFDAIINPPQVAILAIGAGRKVPVFEGDQVVGRTVLTVTLSSDHRVVDGALGARFLAALKKIVESPARLLV